MDDTETRAKILNEFKEELNEGDLKIKFIAAITGSIIIHSDIDTDALITDTSLQKELTTFMKRILNRGRLQITSFQWIDAVIFLVEGILTCKLVLFKNCFFFTRKQNYILYSVCILSTLYSERIIIRRLRGYRYKTK